jgi:hypothetical protein
VKKYIWISIVLAVLIPCLLLATGTVTQTYTPIYSSEGNTNLATLTMVLTSDASGNASGETNMTITDQIAGKYIVTVTTNPDNTNAPTASYDITITDEDGIDVMGGALQDRSATASEQTVPALLSGVYLPRPITGTLTANMTSAGSGKTSTMTIIMER